jgi:hypothetical protein
LDFFFARFFRFLFCFLAVVVFWNLGQNKNISLAFGFNVCKKKLFWGIVAERLQFVGWGLFS